MFTLHVLSAIHVWAYHFLFQNCNPRTPFPLLTLTLSIHTTGLAERIDIEHPLLNNKIETTEFIILATNFDSLEMFMQPLGLLPAQQADVKNRQFLNGTRTAIMECLSLWKQRNPAAATYRSLVKLLLRMRRDDIASQVYKHCLDNSKLT